MNPKKKHTKLTRAIRTLLFVMLGMIACLFIIHGIVVVVGGGRILKVSNDAAGIEEALDQEMDCILILGAGVRNGKPMPMLQERLDTGLALYEHGAAKKIIVSGDHGRAEYDEVNIMKQYLIDQGVPSEDIFMDHAGFSTYESMYRMKAVFEVKSAMIVTQKYHLFRAVYIANALGVKSLGVDCEQVRYGGTTYREVRECMARVKDFFYCIIKPKPTYLGEPIPITGSGDLTND